MNSGMYPAVSGALAAQTRLDIIANNLANGSTTGFKKGSTRFESLVMNNIPPNGADAPVLTNVSSRTDMTQGPLRQTGTGTDVAIVGDAFFTVRTPAGLAYTKQGSFHLDPSGKLVTTEGNDVLGNGKTIVLPSTNFSITKDGEIMVDGQVANKLDLASFNNASNLVKLGAGLYQPSQGMAPIPAGLGTAVQQGYLEESNVNTMLEMANLIETNRQFESCQKVIQSYDTISGMAAGELGKV